MSRQMAWYDSAQTCTIVIDAPRWSDILDLGQHLEFINGHGQGQIYSEHESRDGVSSRQRDWHNKTKEGNLEHKQESSAGVELHGQHNKVDGFEGVSMVDTRRYGSFPVKHMCSDRVPIVCSSPVSTFHQHMSTRFMWPHNLPIPV